MKNWIAVLALLLSACGGPGRVSTPAPPIPPAPVAPAARGGSNLLSYTIPNPSGFIAQFDAGQAIITQQLQAMYANGQRRLKIPILFYDGANDGIAVSSS